MESDTLQEDIKLWGKCTGGDRAAWDILVDKYQKLVCWTVRDTLKKYSNPPEIDWQDIYQDVFIKVLEKLHQWKRKASLATYLKAIAFRTTIDWLRERKYIPLENDERTENSDPIPEIFIKELLEYLSPKERFLLIKIFIEEWSMEEIAQILNKDIGAVYTMKSRLLDKLRKICQKHGLL